LAGEETVSLDSLYKQLNKKTFQTIDGGGVRCSASVWCPANADKIGQILWHGPKLAHSSCLSGKSLPFLRYGPVT
jgi:hypothetical protein